VTILVDPEGVVRRLYQVKDVNTHPDEVLDDIVSLSGAG
jgi:cytochrome oxidase Cu insertion factor (SCO1/SenC/PrrC family)